MSAISIPPIAMATLMFYVGFYHFLIYRRQKYDRENFTFALSCLAVGLYAICCSGLYNVSSGSWRTKMGETGDFLSQMQGMTMTVIFAIILFSDDVFDIKFQAYRPFCTNLMPCSRCGRLLERIP